MSTIIDQDSGRGTLLKAYGVAVLFVGLFIALLASGSKLAPSLGEPAWALLVAAALTAPALVPWLAANVLPRIHSIKISEIEIALTDHVGSSQAVSLALESLRANLQDNPVLTEYAGRMTSLSSSIITAIQLVQGEGHQVLAIDLATPWVAPNLYFLALMAAQKTLVQEFVFIDSRFSPGRFICFSSPGEVMTALEWRRPELKQAALAAQFDQYPQSAQFAAGSSFFQQLSGIYGTSPETSSVRITPFTAQTLLWTLGTAAHQDSFQWVEPFGEKQARTVLASESSFVAALSGNQLLFLVSRDWVATSVARALLK